MCNKFDHQIILLVIVSNVKKQKQIILTIVSMNNEGKYLFYLMLVNCLIL